MKSLSLVLVCVVLFSLAAIGAEGSAPKAWEPFDFVHPMKFSEVPSHWISPNYAGEKGPGEMRFREDGEVEDDGAADEQEPAEQETETVKKALKTKPLKCIN